MRKSTWVILVVVAIAAAGVWWWLRGNVIEVTTGEPETAVRAVVSGFGGRLKLVSTLAPPEDVRRSIEEQYAIFITPELLANWSADPGSAPGRGVSSPWPERIEVDAVTASGTGAYAVTGRVVYITSVEQISGGSASEEPVRLLLTRQEDGAWRIARYENLSGAKRPADAEFPAAPVCAVEDGATATVHLAPDVPAPRCVRALPWQRLSVTNRTEATTTVVLGRINLTIGPGEEKVTEETLGEYLMPGVHNISLDLYAGSGPTIWLAEPRFGDYELTASDTDAVFTYTPTSRFSVTLDSRDSPPGELECRPSGIVGVIATETATEPPRYTRRFEAVRSGICVLSSGTFQATVIVIAGE